MPFELAPLPHLPRPDLFKSFCTTYAYFPSSVLSVYPSILYLVNNTKFTLCDLPYVDVIYFAVHETRYVCGYKWEPIRVRYPILELTNSFLSLRHSNRSPNYSASFLHQNFDNLTLICSFFCHHIQTLCVHQWSSTRHIGSSTKMCI